MDLEDTVLGIFSFVGGIDFNIVWTLLGLALVIFWLVIVSWVWIDSGERTSDRNIRIMYVLITLFLNIPGLIIYLVLRPGSTIEEIYWTDLERRYLKYETSDLGDCPECGAQLFPGYVHCVNCGYQVKHKCPNCQILVSNDCIYCPHCGTKLRTEEEQQEEVPTPEVMEESIKATKEHVTETVESKKTKYKYSESFIIKLGSSIIHIWEKLTKKVVDTKDTVIESGRNIERKKKKKKNKHKKR